MSRAESFAALQAADDQFQAELERQFGKRAGDARYDPTLHDERTADARRAYRAAMRAHEQSQAGAAHA